MGRPSHMKTRARQATLVTLLLTLSALALPGQPTEPLDLAITGGRVMDGSGNPWFRADVGIRDGRIVTVGRLTGAKATRTLDATGRLIVPGFIDLHSHADRGLTSDEARRRAAPNLEHFQE